MLSVYFFRIAAKSRIAPSTSSCVWLSDYLKYWNSSVFFFFALFAASVWALISSFNISSSFLCLSSFLLGFNFFFFDTGFFLSLKSSRSARLRASSFVEASLSSAGLVRFLGFPTGSFPFFRWPPLLSRDVSRGKFSSYSVSSILLDEVLTVLWLAAEELRLTVWVAGERDVPASMTYLGFTESLVPQISSG